MPTNSFSMSVTVVTPDKLRQIRFKLSKELVLDDQDQDRDGDTKEVLAHWSIEFGLDERAKATDKFETTIVAVTIDLTSEVEKAKAEATLQNGPDPAQSSALSSTANDLKLFKANKITERSLKNSLKRIISRRQS